MRERVVRVGQHKPLCGVISEPDQAGDGNQEPAVILLNSGIMHRVGSCRVSVKIARAITEQLGLSCLRFDLSGIGDSEPRRPEGLDTEQMAVQQVREAMDFLEQTRGIRSFILYGLCSGAFTSCRVGVEDSRVKAIVQIDGYCYPTWRSYAHYYIPRILSVQRWCSKLRYMLGRVCGEQVDVMGAGMRSDSNFEVPDASSTPEKAVVAAWMSALAEREVFLHCIFTGREDYLYPNQFRDCFRGVDFSSRLSVQYLPESSHILSQSVYQQQVSSGIVAWISGLIAVQSSL